MRRGGYVAPMRAAEYAAAAAPTAADVADRLALEGHTDASAASLSREEQGELMDAIGIPRMSHGRVWGAAITELRQRAARAVAVTPQPVAVAVPPPAQDVDTVLELALAVAARAPLAVTTRADCIAAAECLKQIKAAQRQVDELRRSMTRPLDESKARIIDMFRPPTARLDEAERAVKAGLRAFDAEQARLAAEEQRRLDAAAKAERDRLAALAAHAEERAQAEQARLQAEADAARAAGDLAKAAKVEAKAEARAELVESRIAVLDMQASRATAPTIRRDPPKVAGVTRRQVPKFEIVDPSAVPREYLVVDEQKIRRVVAVMKMDVAIPGVRVWMETEIAGRG